MSHQTLSLFIKILKALSKHSQSYAVITYKIKKLPKWPISDIKAVDFKEQYAILSVKVRWHRF